jgi:hypothetical protein
MTTAFIDGDTAVLIVTSDGSFLRWQLPSPLVGDSDAITLWAEVLTGERIGEDSIIRPIPAEEWRELSGKLRAVRDRLP